MIHESVKNCKFLRFYPELTTLIGNIIPDYRGVFLRGYGTQVFSQQNGSRTGITSTNYSSGNLNQIQGDAIRNITGGMNFGLAKNPVVSYQIGSGTVNGNGALYAPGYHNAVGAVKPEYLETYVSNWGLGINAGYSVPTSNENRPINIAVKYLIRALN